jgi:hypothetical protein
MTGGQAGADSDDDRMNELSDVDQAGVEEEQANVIDDGDDAGYLAKKI